MGAEPVRYGQARARLTSHERRTIAAAAAAPVAIAGAVLSPWLFRGEASLRGWLAASAVYGGLLGLAAAFVIADRAQARRCPRCGAANDRGAVRCAPCHYDIRERPRFACEDRHLVYADQGICDCGRRLQQLPPARGIQREITVMVAVGAGLLVFLLIAGGLATWLSR